MVLRSRNVWQFGGRTTKYVESDTGRGRVRMQGDPPLLRVVFCRRGSVCWRAKVGERDFGGTLSLAILFLELRCEGSSSCEEVVADRVRN